MAIQETNASSQVNLMTSLQQELDALTTSSGANQKIVKLKQEEIKKVEDQQSLIPEINAASANIVQKEEAVVSQGATLTALSEDLNAQYKDIQRQVLKKSGLEMTTAEAVKISNAPAMENYKQEVGDPTIQRNMDRYRNEIAVYSGKLAELNADTSFMGGIKRMTFESVYNKRLQAARSNLASSQGRIINANKTLQSSLNANQAFGNAKSVLERKQAEMNLLQAESLYKIIQSDQSTQNDKLTQAGRLLQLDKTRLGALTTKLDLLGKDVQLSNSQAGMLIMQAQASQAVANLAPRMRDADQQVQMQDSWTNMVNESNHPPEEKKMLLTLDVNSPKIQQSNEVVQAFLIDYAKRGTLHREAMNIQLIHRQGIEKLTDPQKNVMRMIESQRTSKKLLLQQNYNEQKALTPIADRMKHEELEATYKANLKELATPEEGAKLYGQYINNINTDASAAIYDNVLVIPNWNETFQLNPALEGALSTEYTKILNSTDYMAIDLSLKAGTDIKSQIMSVIDGNIDYILKQENLIDDAGRPDFSNPATGKLITTLSKGMADYYNAARLLNVQTDNGLDNGKFEKFNISGVGELTNLMTWQQVIRQKLKSRTGSILNRMGIDIKGAENQGGIRTNVTTNFPTGIK